jgi:Rrf2 family cysteine metabolism transcriptional repressor
MQDEGYVVLSQRSQYAVRAVFELAKREGSGPVKAASIASAQYIPLRFLENILAQLRQAEIVESVRGKEGGYRLAVGEVIRAVQGPMSAIDCADAGVGSGRECALRHGCVLLPMWDKAHRAMMDVYDGTTLEDLLEQELATHGCEAVDYAI